MCMVLVVLKFLMLLLLLYLLEEERDKFCLIYTALTYPATSN